MAEWYRGCGADGDRTPPLTSGDITAQHECPGRDLNPHGSLEPGGFKPPVSANSTTRATSKG